MQSPCLQITFRKLVEQMTVSNTETLELSMQILQTRNNLFGVQYCDSKCNKMHGQWLLLHTSTILVGKVQQPFTLCPCYVHPPQSACWCQQVSAWTCSPRPSHHKMQRIYPSNFRISPGSDSSNTTKAKRDHK